MIGFADFLRAVRHVDPYPWQQRFAAAASTGALPLTVATPTGTGKTAIVDALVWALAVQAERPTPERSVGVRIVWAIDRRILVDEVHEHASELAKRLAGAASDPEDPLHLMAVRLAALSEDEPLVATRWRGGLDERPRLHGPLQPEIVTSTVAQIGSRLLFRGYGVGEGSLALAAGLAACDTTICLDEAHLAEPFRQTVAAVRAHRQATERTLALPALSAITITATPPRADADVLRLDEADHAALGRRLTAPKRALLVDPGRGTDAQHVDALATAVQGHLQDGARTVACVVNTVGRARAVHDALAEADPAAANVILLMGPQRPADRQALLERHGAALFGGESPERPLVCVATQTFEVGLDADVEALVTESASASALVQRLGRLNRRGLGTGRATVVRDQDRWLYAADEPAAWEWLTSRQQPDGSIDVSVLALDGDGDRPAPAVIARAPALTAPVVELLAQTSPRPGTWADPDVEPFLNGIESEPGADVAVCWRADLRLDQTGEAADEYRRHLLELAPPGRQELLTLGVGAARALLAVRFPMAGRSAAAVRFAVGEPDVEGVGEAGAIPEPGARAFFLVIRAGEVQSDAVRTRDLRPGDTLVLPTEAGGADCFGLALRSPRASDVAGDVVSSDAGRPAPVRLSKEALTAVLLVSLDGAPADAVAAEAARVAPRIARRCARAEHALQSEPSATRDQRVRALMFELEEELWAAAKGVGGPTESIEHPHPALAVLLTSPNGARVALRSAGFTAEELLLESADDANAGEREEPPAEIGNSDAATPKRVFVLVPVPPARQDEDDRPESPPTLEDHATAVVNQAARFAAGAGLDEAARATLRLAAAAHDHGKADPRVQAFYRRGAAVWGASPIAKSEFGTRDPRMARIARELSGMPSGLRHEIASVAVLTGAFVSGRIDGEGIDADLALHLVGSHHGRGRPLPPVPGQGTAPAVFHVEAAGVSGEAVGDGLDGWDYGAWFARFWRILGRYGPWGAAYLEALLVSADRTVSAEGG